MGTEYESEWEKVFNYSFCYLVMLLPHTTISAIEVWLGLARQAEVLLVRVILLLILLLIYVASACYICVFVLRYV